MVWIYGLVTPRDGHVLHLGSGKATDVPIYTKLNVDPCTEKFTPCQGPLSASAFLNPALHTRPGLGAVRLYVLVSPVLLPGFQFLFLHFLPRASFFFYPLPPQAPLSVA